MRGRSGRASDLARLAERVAEWRAKHGGRGVRWPDELWAGAVVAAEVEGVAKVAEAIGVARDRLAARIARREAMSTSDGARASAFVEMDPISLCSAARTVLRFEEDGRKLEIELGDRVALDVVALARSFWSGGR